VDVSVWDTVFPALTWDEYNDLPAEMIAARVAFRSASNQTEEMKLEAKQALEMAKAKAHG
jgi:hypothetical protein